MKDTKIPIIRRVSAFILALIIGFSVGTGAISSNLEVITSQNAYASSSSTYNTYNQYQIELLSYAAKFLGAPYTWAGRGASVSDSAGTWSLWSDSAAYSHGFDCSGFVYHSLVGVGYRTSGFGFQIPVPRVCRQWTNNHTASNLKVYYKGALIGEDVPQSNEDDTTPCISADVITLSQKYDTIKYWDIEYTDTYSEIVPGSIVVYTYTGEDGNATDEEVGTYSHMFLYLGYFESRSEVVDFVVNSLGVDSSTAEKYVEKTNSTSNYWRIECGGIAGDHVGINNSTSGKKDYYVVSVYTFSFFQENTGSLKITKSSEDGVISGVQFQVTGVTAGVNSTYSEIVTTGSDGTVQIDDLVLGDYKVTEINTKSYYVKPESQTVEVTESNTPEVPVEVTVTNNLARGDLKVTKTSEDGVVSGLKFRLYGTSTKGTSVDITATTNSSGVATFTDVLVGTYTLVEVDTPDYYVTPDSQKVTITDDSVASATYASAKVTNYRKWFNVTVTKVDADTGGAAQGDATLAGAVYGIYQNGELVSTYTTDANGQFTTNYYLCGDGWTIKEITPSEGYLLDETEYSVGAENKLYTIRYNTAPAITSDEDVIYGQIAIIKHTDLGDTGIDTPEDGAVFQVYLKSAGSYDNAEETERDTLTTDESGYAITKDLPYGTYTVHQVSGWDGRDGGEDAEQCALNISTHTPLAGRDLSGKT